ncbi:hypothetical protein BKA70DRAFT_652689 [Coprinopsis sp. MPI-PUGE-AT-0042]|nr:hypothetical protein BKA70DRAFT_652689 [Coprinopsis sp. MPI-PUGE-AT-0042]
MTPLSPRETRRSGRRSAPSASTSKSPDTEQPPRQKDSTTSSRSTMSSSSGNSRNRRPKQEDFDDVVDERKTVSAPSVTSNASTQGTSIAKGKRKGKEKDKHQVPEETDGTPPPEDADGADGDNADEEEQGVTRCVCGNNAEDDPDAGEFMIQCEICGVWQHGLCVGYRTEKEVHDEEYYCEECRPDLHIDLLKKLATKKQRTGHKETTAPPRTSRSHSPTLTKQPSKRRNTMNSRDADFAESLKEIIEATAAEAAAAKDPTVSPSNEGPAIPNGDSDIHTNGKKKRKRAEDEVPTKKRTRSASTTSDRPPSVQPRDDTPMNGSVKAPSQAPAPVSKGPPKGKRGSRKVVAPEAPVIEGEEVTTPSATAPNKRGGTRKGAAAKRPALAHATSNNTSNANQDHSGRRAANTANNQHSTSAAADARAYRNTHAYVVSQQPLLTSWGLPDYLAHLEHILPSHTPQPLEVPSGPSAGPSSGRGDSAERTMERGVKVKWPSKRMSVGDMNKRVRALVEWVGREQASALDRERRRDALEKNMKLQRLANGGDGAAMDVDPSEGSRIPSLKTVDKESSASTMKQMEELMEELIGFQERFGPGAKSRDRERRIAS